MKNDKRKLRVVSSAEKTVLPEVLPDPRRRPTTSAPRARTLAHMQRLLATAAAVGVASVSCGKESATSESGERRGCGKAVGGGKTESSTGGSSGYAVVDPMPTPAHCPEIGPLLVPKARFVAAGAAVHAVLDMPLAPGRDDFKYVSDAVPVAYGVSVVKTEAKPDGVTVTAKIEPDAKYASVSVKATCNQGPTTISAQLSWTGDAKPGTEIAVIVTQY